MINFAKRIPFIPSAYFSSVSNLLVSGPMSKNDLTHQMIAKHNDILKFEGGYKASELSKAKSTNV